MTPNEYQKLAERTSATAGAPLEVRMLHASMGFCTEAGEFMDPIKREHFYNKTFDRNNSIEEIGDLLWYIAEACNALGVDMEEVMIKNIAKLKVRYPDKFTTENALNRNLEEEYKTLK